MKKQAVFLVIFMLLSTSPAFAQEIALSIDEAIAMALRENRDILLKAEDIRKAKGKIAEANAGIFPAATLSAGWTDVRGYHTKDLSSTTGQASLKQYLYKGGRTINTIRQNQDKLEVYQALLDKAKLETILNVTRSFYTLLLAEEYANVNKGILENTLAHLKSLEARYQSGQAAESEILRVQEALSSTQQAYAASLNHAEASAALLKNLLYLDEQVVVRPQGNFDCQPKELAYDEAFLTALKNRPEIRQYEAQERADKKAVAITKADNRPSVYASWDYYARSHALAGTAKNQNDYNIIGLTFSWPVFDGWATKAKIEQSLADLKMTQLNKEKIKKDIALELRSAYLDLKNGIAEIKAAQAGVALYKDTLSGAENKYKAGMISSLDLDDAALGYNIALFKQKQAAYDYLSAKARFDKATGGF